MLKTSLVRASVVSFLLFAAAVSSQAAAIDVSQAVTDIGAQAAPVGLIGVACLLVYGGVKAFGWVRGALK